MPYTKLFTREYSVQYVEVCLRCLGPEATNYLPFPPLMSHLSISEQRNQADYFESNEWEEARRKIELEYSNIDAVKKMIIELEKFGEEYVGIASKVASQVGTQELIEAYQNYLRAHIVYTNYIYLSFLINESFSNKGDEILHRKNIDSSNSNEIVSVLFSPSRKVGILKLNEQLTLYKNKKLQKLTDSMISDLLYQYAWVPCLDLQNDPWTKSDLEQYYRDFVPTSKSTLTFAQAVQEANLNKDEEEFFSVIRLLAYVKDARDVYRRQGVHAALPLFGEVGRRLDLDRQEIAYLMSREIIDGLKGANKVDRKIIEERSSGFLMYWNEGQIIIESNKKYIENFRVKNLQDLSTEEVKGTVASKGYILGNVRIVYGVKDLSKVRHGDILVAITTHPDFVPAMQKAAAIVTNEGGLTSHAAIVSREMNKPCIVGTKNATKVLKDGDIVEVDADAGIVRKL